MLTNQQALNALKRFAMTNVTTTRDLHNGYILIEGNEDDGVVAIWLNGSNVNVTAEYIDDCQDIDWAYLRYAKKHNL